MYDHFLEYGNSIQFGCEIVMLQLKSMNCEL